jgi:hypothetical protein
MRHLRIGKIAAFLAMLLVAGRLPAFEGCIHAVITQGGEAAPLLYTVGTHFLRIEATDTNRPNPVDIWDRQTGALTLVYPHNRSFVRLQPAQLNPSTTGFPPTPDGLRAAVGPAAPAAMPGMPFQPATIMPPGSPPPGAGPQAQPTPAPGALPAPGLPAMPMMPLPVENTELKATGEKTNLLGFACEKFEIKQRGETMEIWATDQLLPFQDYVRVQPPRYGPRMIEQEWAALLAAKNLYPVRASLRFERGPERFRFEVQSVTPQKPGDEDLKLFQPPDGWFEIQPLPL